MRNRMRRSSGTRGSRSIIPHRTSAAQRTALTLANSANRPSPVVFTVRPLCSPIFGSTNCAKCALRRWGRALLVCAHQARITHRIGGEDRGQTAGRGHCLTRSAQFSTLRLTQIPGSPTPLFGAPDTRAAAACAQNQDFPHPARGNCGWEIPVSRITVSGVRSTAAKFKNYAARRGLSPCRAGNHGFPVRIPACFIAARTMRKPNSTFSPSLSIGIGFGRAFASSNCP